MYPLIDHMEGQRLVVSNFKNDHGRIGIQRLGGSQMIAIRLFNDKCMVLEGLGPHEQESGRGWSLGTTCKARKIHEGWPNRAGPMGSMDANFKGLR